MPPGAAAKLLRYAPANLRSGCRSGWGDPRQTPSPLARRPHGDQSLLPRPLCRNGSQALPNFSACNGKIPSCLPAINNLHLFPLSKLLLFKEVEMHAKTTSLDLGNKHLLF